MKIIYNDGTVAECPKEEELHVLRHNRRPHHGPGHQAAVPDADFGYGPATENGFYYDVDLGDTKLTDEDLANIEKEMRKITKENLPIKAFILPRPEAIKLMEDRKEKFKVEHIGDLPEDATISFYQQGEYIDMCVGPHLTYTKALKAFKITQQSGAYWKGDKANKMLTPHQRRGLPHPGRAGRVGEAAGGGPRPATTARSAARCSLFMTDDLVGRGLPMFLPNGYVVWQELENYIKAKERARGYQHVMTPCVGTVNLYKTSGHWDHYRENMFPAMEMEGESYVLRPMNCPHHMMIYANRPHSYRQLPIRIGEIAHDFRYEASGTLKGIERGRHFCQNDAHLFVTPSQIKSEVANVCDLIFEVYKDFGITDYRCVLSLRDPNDKNKYHDDDAMWDHAETALREVLTELAFNFTEEIGEPRPSTTPQAGRQRQARRGRRVHPLHLPAGLLPAGQVPPDLRGQPTHRKDPRGPAPRHPGLHRPLHGLPDRGDQGPLPHLAWPPPRSRCCPSIDIRIGEVTDKLASAGIRVVLDSDNEKIGYKIREAQQVDRVPYMLVLGRQGGRDRQHLGPRPQGRDLHHGARRLHPEGLRRDRQPHPRLSARFPFN